MKVEQIYTGCLAQGAYYIESNGEAAVIDPLREVAPYIQKATNNNSIIKYVFSCFLYHVYTPSFYIEFFIITLILIKYLFFMFFITCLYSFFGIVFFYNHHYFNIYLFLFNQYPVTAHLRIIELHYLYFLLN